MVCLYFQERDPSETEEVLIFFPLKHCSPDSSYSPMMIQKRRRGFEMTQRKGRSLAPGGEVSGHTAEDFPDFEHSHSSDEHHD